MVGIAFDDITKRANLIIQTTKNEEIKFFGKTFFITVPGFMGKKNGGNFETGMFFKTGGTKIIPLKCD